MQGSSGSMFLGADQNLREGMYDFTWAFYYNDNITGLIVDAGTRVYRITTNYYIDPINKFFYGTLPVWYDAGNTGLIFSKMNQLSATPWNVTITLTSKPGIWRPPVIINP